MSHFSINNYMREIYDKYEGDLLGIEGQLHQDYYFEVPEAIDLIGRVPHPLFLNFAIIKATQRINLFCNV
jgi:hypothetical protein